MSQHKTEYIIAITSTPQEEAENIAKIIVDKKLAACVQIIGPVSSFYWWKGEVQKDTEAILLIKTTEKNKEKIKKIIKDIHSYDVPELLFLPVYGGLPEYLKWLESAIENDE